NIPINKNAHKHANKHKPAKTKCSTPTPTPTCCQSRGSSGWNDKFHGISSKASRDANSTTAQDCCKACIVDSDCFQWYFFIDDNRCLLDRGDACLNGTTTPSEKSAEGGIIRCSDGSGSDCRF
ncbi:19601_t:CDS:1, partial [Racocetra fulgida]